MKRCFSVEQTKKLALIIAIIISFITFLTTSLIFSFHLATENKLMSPFFTPFVRYNEQFILILVSLSVFVGTLVTFTMLSRMDKNKQIAKRDLNVLLKLINQEERAIIERILQAGGSILQSELSRAEGLNKVKVHRILARLRQRGILILESYGKTNRVKMEPGLLKTLVS